LVTVSHPHNTKKELERARLPQLASSSVSERDPRTARLPKVPRLLAERLGYDMGMLLMKKFGGVQVSVPAKPILVKGSVIARALGEEAALAMCELFGGGSVEIPTGSRLRRDDRRRAIIDHPGTNNEAARALGVSSRWVRMVRNDPAQFEQESVST
jgi:hypothetical protein